MQDELSIAKADVAILVEERNKLFRELEEYKALYNEAASLLNLANYKLLQIRDIVEVKSGLTQRAADLVCTCPKFNDNPIDAEICGWCGLPLHPNR